MGAASVTTGDLLHLTGGSLLVKRQQAAEMLSMSLDTFERQVQPEIRLVRRGPRIKLVPITELIRWIDENSSRILEDC